MKAVCLSLSAIAVATLLVGCGDDPKPPQPVPAAASVERPQAATETRTEPAPVEIRSGDPRPPLIKEEPERETPPDPVALPEFRPSDVRPRHDAARLEALGIRTFESKRLRLHTDIDEEIARRLPAFIDAAYDAWVDYFGPLPPDRERTEFQVTGYLMTDKDLFRRAGLLPGDLLPFVNGRHRGAEFWMINQPQEYYLRHLMIHEATHCFMTLMPDTRAPVWYLEGMAELFGTHRIAPDGTVTFRVMPENRIDYTGLSRIDIVRADVAAGRFQRLGEVFAFAANDYLRNEPYAWSWAICKLLDTHPRYRERFRTLGQKLTGTQFERAFEELFAADAADLRTEWALFAHGIREGYDFERAAIAFQAGSPFPSGESKAEVKTVEVDAARGWQSSGLELQAGRTYRIRASGQFTLAALPKPWISEPQGISIRYADGRPLGLLLGAIRQSVARTAEQGAGDVSARETMLDIIPIGRETEFTAPVAGTLYLRLNDSWSDLADNRGHATVEIEPVPKDANQK